MNCYAYKDAVITATALTTLCPTIDDLNAARDAFESNEPRDLFYRAATQLIELAIAGHSALSLGEAIAVLLQTWNKAYYRFHAFDQDHLCQIENLITEHENEFQTFRSRTIETCSDDDSAQCTTLFSTFETVLGPVGAAKTLHLMAPEFFPLWDRKIAIAYGLALKKIGDNASLYWQLMLISKDQCLQIGGRAALGRNPLKAIDEYNYCKFTLECT